ncbi:MAG: UvrD-helicase domain-containing protein [Solirubrobacterales bacterium]|nr:UvrD-helicase domain-containing protein [Solirubrobacterales bacterium]
MTAIVEDSRPFEIRGPLASGVTVLEASAGTGKTYTIAALAARYVAEGTPLDQLLLVSFTRMATGELRERVRERLVSVEQGLEAALSGAPVGGDEVIGLLAEGPTAEVQIRRDRIARALGGFDAATIATTHGFCQEVLGGLGIAGDLERDCTFVENVDDLVEEVVDDLYVRRFFRGGETRFDRRQALAIARMAVSNHAAPIAPATGAEQAAPAMRRRFAEKVREEVELRKRRTAVMTYDDLLTRLKHTLRGEGGAAAVARLRARYSVVLVDEFQDTDPDQWEILQRAFGNGAGALVLIGDPKQAIYAFRGADVYAYLEAADAAASRATLRINWRSDQGLIDAYDALFGSAKLGHEGIVYREVRAAAANRTPRLTGAPSAAPLRFRVVHRSDPSVALTRGGLAVTGSVREHVAKDVAADLVELLSSAAMVERRSDDGTTVGHESVRPGHVAVLVRKHATAAQIRGTLDDAGIPAVINGAGSVFATAPALEWLRLLEAVERPALSSRAHSAALTSFIGWSPEGVASAQEADWEAVHRRLHQWARVLRVKGVASLVETITLTERLPRRILTAVDGERRLTDLRHVGHLLHAAAATEHMGTTALTSWLRRRVAEADQDSSDEERSRRLESDAEAVQILTIHRSKGLEFPIVYCPDLWEPTWVQDKPLPVAYHDPEAADARMIDVGLQGPDYDRHKRQQVVEQRGEDLRLAYVALTRAQHQAVVWWAGSWSSGHSSLGRLLFAKEDDGTVAWAGTGTPTDAAAVSRFEALAAEAPGCIGVERSALGLPTEWAGEAAGHANLSAAGFDRDLDRCWRRTSYSDITAGTYEARVASEPEEVMESDELEAPRLVGARSEGGTSGLSGAPCLLASMPGGVQVGTFVHRVFEATDFAAADLDAELELRVTAEQARRRIDVGDRANVIAGLRAAIETPVGSSVGLLRLRDIRRADRLDELDFELPLVGGDEPTARLPVTAIGTVLREYLPAGDPLAGYADRLDDPILRESVRGYLTGSIDLVVRVRDPAGFARFAIVDYKTNWLGAHGEELTAWLYRPAALAAEMQGAHYGLQALLYTVALHRYLRWRLPGYEPERHLAGVLYLFLRGMIGDEAPLVDGTPCGVFAWQPPPGLVSALSDVLDRGVA